MKFARTTHRIGGEDDSRTGSLALAHELKARLEAAEVEFEWDDVLRDLEALELVTLEHQGKHFVLRTEARGVTGQVFRAVGVALPPTFRQLESKPSPRRNAERRSDERGATPA